jgi:endonuclease YncB( thermonuclease family)
MSTVPVKRSWPFIVSEVHDGDTLRGILDLGLSINWTGRLRLRDVNAPELSTPDGVAAREFVQGLIPQFSTVTAIAYQSVQVDNYGRLLASITLPDGQDLGTLLLASGHAVPMPSPKLHRGETP